MQLSKKMQICAPLGFAVALACLPITADLPSAGGIHWSAAFAKDGGSGGGSGGHSGGSGGSGSGSSHGGGSSGSHGGGSGTSGHGGSHESSSADSSGRHGGRDDGEHPEDHGTRGVTEVRNSHGVSLKGAKVEVNGANIEVITSDGFKQEIENGRFEMKDPLGRTVIERPATKADRARLLSFRRR